MHLVGLCTHCVSFITWYGGSSELVKFPAEFIFILLQWKIFVRVRVRVPTVCCHVGFYKPFKLQWSLFVSAGVTLTRQAMCMYPNIEVHSINHFYRGEKISVTYSECVSVVFVTQHAKRMLHILLSCAGCLAVRCFPTLSHKGYDFRGGWGGRGGSYLA